ncbi:Uncharacterized protein SVXHr_0922 [Halorhabdus sp. SVX81]|nr:Uncharacterized protein SVXHr_0922 [Halorhabdus sp. SVX81]
MGRPCDHSGWPHQENLACPAELLWEHSSSPLYGRVHVHGTTFRGRVDPRRKQYEGGSNRGELSGTDENNESGGAGLGILLLGLAVLAIGIALARKLLAGDGEDIEIEA